MAFDDKGIMTTKSTSHSQVSPYPTRRLSTDNGPVGEVDKPEPELELEPKLRKMVADGKTRVSEWRGELQDGIRAKPIQTVLVAAAVGAVIGLLLGRRS